MFEGILLAFFKISDNFFWSVYLKLVNFILELGYIVVTLFICIY